MLKGLKTINLQIFLSLLLLVTLPLLTYMYYVSKQINNGLNYMEERVVSKRFEDTEGILAMETQNMLNLARDHAVWNQMYQGLNERNTDWLQTNLNSMARNYNLDLVIITDPLGNIAFSRGNPLTGIANVNICPAFKKGLQGNPLSGFFEWGGRLYLGAVSPVLSSTFPNSPQAGALMVGKEITHFYLRRLSQYTGYDVSFYHNHDFLGMVSTPELTGAIAGIRDYDSSKVKLLRQQKKTLAYTSFRDMQGDNIGLLFILFPRDAVNASQQWIKEAMTPVIALCLGIVLLLAVLLSKYYLQPIAELGVQLAGLRQKKTLGRVSIEGFGELKRLENVFNELSTTLNEQVTQEKESLTRLAVTDGLTQLYNQAFFFKKIEEEMNAAREKGQDFSLILFDVNFLKYCNNILGHEAGDLLLKEASIAIRDNTPRQGWAARLGGDEFALGLPGVGRQGALTILAEIKDNMLQRDFPGREQLPGGHISISGGVASYPPCETKEELFIQADHQLNKEKLTGPQRLMRFFSVLGRLPSANSSGHELISICNMFLAIVDAIDNFTHQHSLRVQGHCQKIALALGLGSQEREDLSLAALLHDIGKMEVDKEILRKQGPLTENEWRIMRLHPTWGAKMVELIEPLKHLAAIIEHHHQWYDGQGYPRGLRGSEIPLHSRIIALANAFDVMTSCNPYNSSPLDLKQACQELKRGSGTQFDPELVEVFLKLLQAA